jgi:hypothetical protein
MANELKADAVLYPAVVCSSGILWGGVSAHYHGLGLVVRNGSFALVGFVEELFPRLPL